VSDVDEWQTRFHRPDPLVNAKPAFSEHADALFERPANCSKKVFGRRVIADLEDKNKLAAAHESLSKVN